MGQQHEEVNDAAGLIAGPRRRPNYLLEQGRNYQAALVQRLWSSRQ